MYCLKCGADLPDNARFCAACNAPADFLSGSRPAAGGGRIGYSERINDPAFARYIKHTNRWSTIISLILAVAAVLGFYIAGEAGAGDMRNPLSLMIGLGIGGMFLLIALFRILGRKRSATWDGTIEDKKIKKKTIRQNQGDDNVHYEDYLEYSVIIRSDRGKKHVLKTRDNDTFYHYFNIGDRVRHHAGLRSYEKYDKTGDRFIPCNACAMLCNIHTETCPRCKCPLLK